MAYRRNENFKNVEEIWNEEESEEPSFFYLEDMIDDFKDK